MAIRKALRRARNRARTKAHRLNPQEKSASGPVPGPTEDPSTNLMLADIVMRMGSYALRGGVEKAFLKGRYGPKTASDILKNRSLGHTLASVAIAKFATRSLPGAAIVSTGIAAKVLYDRGKSRHQARAEGDADLLEPTEEK